MWGQYTGTWKQDGNAKAGTRTGHESRTGKKRPSEAEETEEKEELHRKVKDN